MIKEFNKHTGTLWGWSMNDVIANTLAMMPRGEPVPATLGHTLKFMIEKTESTTLTKQHEEFAPIQ